MRWRALHPLLSLLPLLALVAQGRGGEPSTAPAAPETFLTRPYLFGDWGGLRTSLADHGVLFNFTYAADGFAIVSGGLRRGVIYNGLLDLGTDVDLEKLLGWKGGQFHVNAVSLHGADGSANYTGDVGVFSNLEAYDTFRLFELWFEQNFADQRFSLRVGQVAVDTEFALLDAYGGLFIQSGFGTPVASSTNLPIAGFPYATLGARLRVQPHPGWALQVGVYDGNPAPGYFPDPTPNAVPSSGYDRHGVDWALRHDEGALLAGEISYRVNQTPAKDEPSPTRTTTDDLPPEARAPSSPAPPLGLAGGYKIGAFYHTDSFAEIGDVTLQGLGSSAAPVRARARSGNYALYASFEQELWREPGHPEQGLGIFSRCTWMPPDRNLVEFSIESGIYYNGLVAGRDADAIGLGISWVSFSDRVGRAIAHADRADGTSTLRPDFEATIELVYRYQFTPWCSLQPHVQYIVQPGGTKTHDDALIFGLRTNLTF